MKHTFVRAIKTLMKWKRIALPLAAVVASAPLHAELLKPLHAHRVQLGDHSAIVYYAPNGAAHEVVTTVASSPLDGDERMRFITPVVSGRKSYVSITGETAPTDTYVLELEVLSNGLSVKTSTQKTVAFHAR
ncbi:MAG: hypothetical protein WC383_07670 [Gammaproteobacteria bacterium]